MGFLFKVAAETIGSQHLHGAEQHKQAQAAAELLLIYLPVALQGTQIGFDKLLFKVFRETGTGLPDEGSHVVVDGTAAASLEIYEPRIPVLDHHVAGLEVPVHESVLLFLEKIGLELFKIVLQQDLVEFQAGCLEETVFEVVEVEVHHPGVEGLLRVAHLPVQPPGPHELDPGQLLDGALQKIRLCRAVQAAFTAFGHHPEKHLVSQVFLDIGALVLTYRIDGGHLEALLAEMPGNGDEAVVFLQIAADGADKG